MTTTNEVKLPELPGFCRLISEDARVEVRQYGTLCYEAGLAAGRGQSGQQGDVKGEVIQFLKTAFAGRGVPFTGPYAEESYADLADSLLRRPALKQSLAQPVQEPVKDAQIKHLRETLEWYANGNHVVTLYGKQDWAASRKALEDKGFAFESEGARGEETFIEHGRKAQETLDAVDAMGAQQPAQAAAPEGWKLVPIEPTDENAKFEKEISRLNYLQTFSHVFSFVEAPPTSPPQRKFLDWSTEMAWIGWKTHAMLNAASGEGEG